MVYFAMLSLTHLWLNIIENNYNEKCIATSFSNLQICAFAIDKDLHTASYKKRDLHNQHTKMTTLMVNFVTDLAQQINLSSKYFVLPLSSHKWSPVPICVQTDSLITLSSHTLHEKSLQYTECCSSSCSFFRTKINKMIRQICKKNT